MPQQRFANHPGAEEAPAEALEYHYEPDSNPSLNGLSLVVGSYIISNLSIAQKYLWENAKFGLPKFAPGLTSDVLWRLQPNVAPLGSPQESMLSIDTPDFLTPTAPTLPGRFNSVADYHDLYKSGTATPLDVINALLPLITRGGSEESKYAVAFIQTNASEVLASARASTARWAEGRPLSILDGVPFGVKDDTKVKGYVSTRGMKVDTRFPYFSSPETQTAWPAEKMIDMGAIMVGKMNQHEVGMDTTGCNPTTGTATNWFNPKYYPGGSSSGAGSALSAGLVPITVGTDSGGSMRIPPGFCGVYGLKPTFNRTCSVNSSVCVVGPMTATLGDLVLAYRVMSQPNVDDPPQAMLAQSIPPPAVLGEGETKYLGVCKGWIERADPEVRGVFDKVLGYLTTQCGYTAVDIKLPYLREGQLAHAAICLSEAATEAKSRHPEDWLALLNHPNRILVAGGSQTPAYDYLKYSQIRQVIMAHLAWLWEKYPGMMVLTPTTPMAGWKIQEGDQRYGLSDANNSIRNMTYCWYANMAGCPALTVPGGYVDDAEGTGRLAVGMMAMGEWGEEERLFSWGREVDRMVAEKGGREKGKEWIDVIGLAKEKKNVVTAE